MTDMGKKKASKLTKKNHSKHRIPPKETKRDISRLEKEQEFS
jgi:hypothetical protein